MCPAKAEEPAQQIFVFTTLTFPVPIRHSQENVLDRLRELRDRHEDGEQLTHLHVTYTERQNGKWTNRLIEDVPSKREDRPTWSVRIPFCRFAAILQSMTRSPCRGHCHGGRPTFLADERHRL
jgi:hypothetical protein